MDSNVSNIADITTASMETARNADYTIIPEETVLLIRKICYIWITPFLSIVGLFFNSFCLAMFCKLQTKTSTVIMLFGLTVADIVILLAGTVNALLQASVIYGQPFLRQQRIETIPYFSAYINGLPGRIGNLLTLLIATERLFCVLRPMKIRLYSTKKNAYIAVILLYILPVLISTPNLFLYRTQDVYSNITGKHRTILTRTDYGKNEELTNTIFVITELIFRYIPVLGVTVASAITSFIVVLTSKQRSKLTKGSLKSGPATQESQVTKMLLVVTTAFVACNLPGTILRMIIFIDPEMTPFSYKNNVYDAAFPVTYILYMINSVVNLIIYYKTSSTYRKKIKAMLGWNTHGGVSREVSTVSDCVNSTSQCDKQ